MFAGLTYHTQGGNWLFSSMVVFGTVVKSAICPCRRLTRNIGRINSQGTKSEIREKIGD